MLYSRLYNFRQKIVFLFALTLSICTLHFSASSQDVVISEYKNIVSVPTGEFTELLIIKDKFDLVGFTLRDNSAAGTWQGGITFKNVPLWKNLRTGTVILIFHRGTAATLDIITSDGSIVLSAEDAAYFDKVVFNTTDWNANALNIAQAGDMMQLLDASSNPHHTVGHGPASYRSNYFDMITGAKLFHEISSITFGVYAYPGASIADYSMPNPSNSKTVDAFYETPSYPNINSIVPAATQLNSLYWRSIRQPQWNNPTITATLSLAGANLSWNSMVDNYPQDTYQGYMILRGPANAKDTVPQDGKTYSNGMKLGDWDIVTHINNSLTTTYLDVNPLPCGEEVKYRIFAYRYGSPQIDSALIAQSPITGKGRSYNETSFASFTALRQPPAIPTITASGATEICEGTSILLKMQGTLVSGTGYEWYKDGAPISGARSTEYLATKAGTYKLRIVGLNGCSNESLPITITTIPKPIATLNPTKEIRICSGDSTVLQAGPAGLTYAWLYNGTSIGSNQPIFNAKMPGNYQVIVRDAKGCFDTSDITMVINRNVAIKFADPSINFGTLDGCKASVTQSSLIRNPATDTAIITSVDVPAGFQFTSPTLPIIVPPGKTATLTFTFAPNQAGSFNSNATVKTSTCDAIATIALIGVKEQASVAQSYSTADFGSALSCTISPKDTILIIENKGTGSLSINKATIASPFLVLSPSSFPLIIPAGNKAQITIRYAPSGQGQYNEILVLPYTSGTCIDTLRIAFKGEVIKPDYVITDTAIVMDDLFGCTMYADTMISITNTGKTTITLLNQASPGITLSTLPLTLKPQDNVLLMVRVQPPTDGNYKGTISFMSNECGLKKNINISLNKSSANYQISNASLLFKNIIRCDTTVISKDSIIVTANALGIAGEASIGKIVFGNGFSTGLNVGDKLINGSITFPVYFEPKNNGTYSDSLTITFEPCSITKTIALQGSLQTSTFSILESLVSFPVTDSGKTEQKTFTFTNTGDEPVTINSVSGIEAPFSYSTSTDISKPIAPGSTVIFTVTFAPIGNSQDSIMAVLSVGGACPKTVSIAIIGKGNKPKPTDINGTAELLSDDRTAAPGKQVSFPFRVSSQNIDVLKIDSMSFSIRYNPTLLLPTGIKPKQTGISASFKESTPGILDIIVSSNDTAHYLSNGALCELECTALLGDAMSTKLIASNQQFSKRTPGTFAFTVYNPLFTLENVCDLPGRLMKIDGQFSLSLQKEGLAFEVVTQDNTILELYSTIGERLYTLKEGSLHSGIHIAPLPEELPSGLYLAILRSGRFMRTLPFGFLR